MSLPTFLIIGAAKSGTTSLYEYLGQHPEVFMSEVKEPKYFAWDEERPSARLWPDYPVQPHLVRDEAAYRALFEPAGDEKVRGEASVIYLESLFAPQRIRAELPAGTKFIVSLRNPAERAYSDYLMAVRRGWDGSVAEGLAAEQHRVQVGFYHRLLSRYYELFPAEDFRVMIFEEWRAEPEPAIQGLFEFLGVDPGYVPNLQGRHNKGGLPRNRWLHKQMLQRSGWRGTVLKYTPKPLRRLGRWAYYNNLKHPGPMPDDARRRLIDLYRPDIEKLQGLIGKDLSGWLA